VENENLFWTIDVNKTLENVFFKLYFGIRCILHDDKVMVKVQMLQIKSARKKDGKIRTCA